MTEEAIQSFNILKRNIESAIVTAIDPNEPFVVETDASNSSIAAVLNQQGRPVAFFSRTLSKTEQHHSAIEKEAYAIVEALKKWRHYLLGHHFKLVTDQKSVSFMFDSNHNSKIKNEKILRWRIELSPYSFDIVYRAGTENVAADTFSRISASMATSSAVPSLKEIHSALCHPGITRLIHFIKVRNLPYSTEDVKKITNSCSICSEVKLKFYKHEEKPKLIKAIRPFDRLNLDFKGPLPSTSRNKYLLVIVDEYSRFPFAYPCCDMSSSTVIKCLTDLFCLFGTPSYIHSDQGPSFMSKEFREFLLSRNIASSRTTPYNPQGNGLVERLNGTIWRTITLALKEKGLQIQHWELVLKEALHSIRTLLCTATNETPHERLFRYDRRSPSGYSLPSWLRGDRALLKRQNRNSKYEAFADEVTLLDVNPTYAHIKHSDGTEATVSLKQLAPWGDVSDASNKALEVNDTHNIFEEAINSENKMHEQTSETGTTQVNYQRHCDSPIKASKSGDDATNPETSENEWTSVLRRSERVRKRPQRYGFE